MKKFNVKKTFIIIITVILIFTFLTNSILLPQVKQDWAAIYNGTENSKDGAASLAADCSGNVYVTGMCTNKETREDFATIK